MRKRIYPLLFSFLTLFLIGNTLSSCEAEKDFAAENSHDRLVVKTCSMKDVALQTNMKLMNSVSKLKSFQAKSLLNSANNKLVYNANAGLFYDDEKGIFVSKDGKESYNFNVIQVGSNSKIVNILFNKNEQNEYDIYLVKYNYTKEDLQNFSKEVLAQREIKYQVLLKNGVEYPVDVQWFLCVDSTYISYVFDGTYVQIDGENFDVYCPIITVSFGCIYGWDNDGGVAPPTGGGINTGGGGGGIGGGGSTGSTNPPPSNTNPPPNPDNGSILAAAVIDIDNPLNNQILPPCEELKKLCDPTRGNGSIKTNVDLLKQKVNSNNNNRSEIGFEAQKVGNADGSFTYTNTDIVGNQYNVPIETGFNYIGGGHNHPFDGYPMFSFGDLQVLSSIYIAASPQRKEEVYFMLVCKNQETGITKTYAIKVDDIDKLTNELNAVWTDPKYVSIPELNNERIDKIHKDQAVKYKQSNGQYEKSFFQQFGGYGISLYEATNEALTNWNKLELGTTSGNAPELIVNSTPCN